MFPLKKIICPTDFSAPARTGLDTAVELAEKYHANLIVLHAISPMPMMNDTGAGAQLPVIIEALENDARQAMDKLILEAVPENIRVDTVIVHGTPANEITSLAEKEKADLIVIATHGESGWQRFFFGSVSERVVHKADCDVLTVRPPKKK